MSDPFSMAAAEYVLGTLDLTERREFERRLASDPLLRAQVVDWQIKLDPLAQSIAPIEPSVALWDRIDETLDQMERGDNVVLFNRQAVRRSIIKPRVVAAVFGAMAASIAAFALAPLFDGLPSKPERPAVSAIAPSSTVQAPTKAANAIPCPSDPSGAVQTANSPKESLAERETSPGSVAVANAVGGQGAIVVGGKITTGEVRQPGKPVGPDNVTVASAADTGCK